MRGLLHVGLRNQTGGRMGDTVSTFSDCLRELGFEVGRFKTGTPCRLLGKKHRLFPMRASGWRRARRRCSAILRTPSCRTKTRSSPSTRWKDGVFPCAADSLLDHAHERGDSRDHPREPRQVSSFRRSDRGRWAALLPKHRGQGREVRGEDLAPALPGTGGPPHRRGLRERGFHQPAFRGAIPLYPQRSRPRECGDPATWLCGGIRLLSAHAASHDPGDEADRRALFRRADQRHLRLRGSGRPGADRRSECGIKDARTPSLSPWPATKPTSAS